MKNKILSLILIGLSALAAAPPARAQTQTPTNIASVTFAAPPTNAAPATPQGFLTSVQDYFTIFSTLTPFSNGTNGSPSDLFDVWTSYEYVNGSSSAASIGVSYQTPITFGPFRLGAESVTRNAPGLAGTLIYSQAVGPNIQYVTHDVKVLGYIDATYDWQAKGMGARAGVRFFKALTANTFGLLEMSEGLSGGKLSSYPTIGIGAGAIF